MEFEREKQSLLLEGVRYTANDLHLLKTKVVGASDSSTGQILDDSSYFGIYRKTEKDKD